MKVFKNFQYQTIRDENGVIDGEYETEDGIVIRCKKGYLCDDVVKDGDVEEILPAVSTSDTHHIEHWKDGVLHFEKGAAVIDLDDKYEEFWENGKFIKRIEK